MDNKVAHIVIAPNAFKHALSATEAAEAIAAGFHLSTLDCSCTLFPVGDGGTGTGSLLVAHFGGKILRLQVMDPLGKVVQASYGLIHNETVAVIDLASASGIHLLAGHSLDLFNASTYGTGQLFMDALNRGVRKFVVGVGGTATVDGGAGVLKALGARFLDNAGQELEGTPQALKRLVEVDLSAVDSRFLASEVQVLCDVDNVLFGRYGGLRMFAPQKGAADGDLDKLEFIYKNYFNLLASRDIECLDRLQGGGAGGGVAAALFALGNAELIDGASHFLELTGFRQKLETATFVVTGEGAFDEQTLHGKAPYAVAKLAKEYKLPVLALTGKRPLSLVSSFSELFDGVFTIGDGPCPLSTALLNTKDNLIETAKQLGNIWGK